jgi:hypothetical protein
MPDFQIPIIALSAHARAGARDGALEAGCDDFDTEPVGFDRRLPRSRTRSASAVEPRGYSRISSASAGHVLRHLDADRVRDLGVHRELELGGQFHRQIAWLCAAQHFGQQPSLKAMRPPAAAISGV